MAATKTQKILRYALWSLLGVGIGALLLYFLVVRPLQIHSQKQNFTKAEASLDTLEKQIEAKIGKPDQIKKVQECSYISQEFGKGPRSCEITFALLYLNKNNLEATELMSNAAKVTGNPIKDHFNKITAPGFMPASTQRIDQIFYQDVFNKNPLSCSLQYSYPLYPRYYGLFHPDSVENLQIDIGCRGSAMVEFYPVKN